MSTKEMTSSEKIVLYTRIHNRYVFMKTYLIVPFIVIDFLLFGLFIVLHQYMPASIMILAGLMNISSYKRYTSVIEVAKKVISDEQGKTADASV